ncbi:hypothetical protein [Ewingella americana]|uniref:Uncharacterized protein n=1 Tax=Ewingella americana TaxID=41202 RepID=A0A502GE36_9GAMM|nr:hypothetical protein [Ewingella americana]TPG60134.1 hypothetical protein EAH77_16325 [Ewingella americana]
MANMKDVDARKLASRPYIHDRTSGNMVKISPEFEVFLIKAPDDLKKAIASHVETTMAGDVQNQLIKAKAVANFGESRVKRQREILENNTDKVNKVKELTTKISQVGAGDIAATSSVEKTNLIQDLQHGQVYLEAAVRSAEFQTIWMSHVIQEDGISPKAATVQRMRSWSNSLFAYPED